jgi:hypothetical protein
MDNETVSSTKEEEIIGGLTNAIKRGESLDQARGTFLNAGYPPEIVNMAARRLMGGEAELAPQTTSSGEAPASNLNLYAQQQNKPIPQAAPRQKTVVVKKSSPVPYWAVVLMLLIAVGILVGAGVLGLYWHKLFPPA